MTTAATAATAAAGRTATAQQDDSGSIVLRQLYRAFNAGQNQAQQQQQQQPQPQQQRQQERRFAEEMSELAREIDEDLAAHNDEEQFEEVDPEEEKNKNLDA
ncbi:hypothetical protein BDB00DRAFT_933437 [Zychaea mexicana]|uniref:uncharacterized protein n=1 Tax=Zychaea mexicana TaxID=64656 RepID=UPI0022FF3B81|nr:uncharacterized protein BDB00DRAFT_933437 [Zychaea mexicana]KAI9484756.1 hypothetical protein BDB00DRAFT_933437 [Zychaea mexicana]